MCIRDRNLGERAALEPAAQQLIQLRRARGDHDGVLTALLHHRRGREPERHDFQGCGGYAGGDRGVSRRKRGRFGDADEQFKTGVPRFGVARDAPAALSFSTFISLRPLISFKAFFEACASPSTVCTPASTSFLMSDAATPCSCAGEGGRRVRRCVRNRRARIWEIVTGCLE